MLRYDMTSPKDIVWIYEIKGVLIHHRWKANMIHSWCVPTSTLIHVLIPTNPQKIDPAWTIIDHVRADVSDVGMKNTEDTGINVRVVCNTVWITGAISQKHDVAVRCRRLNNVLCPADVVRHIVEAHQTMPVKPVANDVYGFFQRDWAWAREAHWIMLQGMKTIFLS